MVFLLKFKTFLSSIKTTTFHYILCQIMFFFILLWYIYDILRYYTILNEESFCSISAWRKVQFDLQKSLSFPVGKEIFKTFYFKPVFY